VQECVLMLCNANVPGVATEAETVTEAVVEAGEEAAVASATLTRKAT
jgi:hypothetical protein